MEDRFTHNTRFGRGCISKTTRKEIFNRDGYTCVYCGAKHPSDELTIEHLVPLSLGGHDEKTNYVTACFSCNNRKGSTDLIDFCNSLNIDVREIPVYGDPIIDNSALPIALRSIRKRIFGKYRLGEIKLQGKSSQKKIEKTYRREFWQTIEGKKLEAEFPNLPGHTRIMIPEIQTIAGSRDEFLLLLELAKSANTRNLINENLKRANDIIGQIEKLSKTTQDLSLQKRLVQALSRFEKARRT